MIIVGSVFAFILLIYVAYFFQQTNDKIHDERARQIYYNSKNLNKMEYDIAFPAKNSVGQDDEKQLTMDEVINESNEPEAEFEMPIFNVTEFEGSKEITGRYNPDSDD